MSMIGVSVSMLVWSTKNRMQRRFARLRDPRYIAGAIAGALYFAFILSRAGFGRGRQQPLPLDPLSGAVMLALPMLVVATVAWVVPFRAALLDFTQAEMHLLFPAPVPRWQLIVHRLIRAQLGLLLGPAILAAVMPFSSGFARVRWALGIWCIVVTGRVYFTGVAMARARLRSPDAGVRRFAWIPVAAIVAVVLAVGVPLAGAAGAAIAARPDDVRGILVDAVSTGIVRMALWPFLALSGLLFAQSLPAFLIALPGALLVMTAVLVWVLRSDVVFQEVAEAAAPQRSATADRVMPAQRGLTPWRLGLTGRAEAAFVWKGATETLRGPDWIVAAIGLIVIAVATLSGRRELTAAVSVLALIGAGFALVLGPQAYRADLRQDFEYLDLLKTWPVRAGTVIRGELLWPSILLTVMSWVLLVTAWALSDSRFANLSTQTRAVLCAAAIAAAPGLIALQYAIQAAVTLLFPAWVQIGRQRPRGFEVAGQRLVSMAATWVAMGIALIPGVLVAGLVWLALSPLIGPWAAVVASAAATTVLGLETLAATEVLASQYERLDLTGIERAEN